MKILIVEDEVQLLAALKDIIAAKGDQVDVATNGIKGEELALTGTYDIIILDIMLPGKNGLEVLKELRKEKIKSAILLLTAKAEVEDKIKGLDLGADDYLTKPFSTGELLARLRALGRRGGIETGEELELNGLVLDKQTYQIRAGGEEVKLGAKEFRLLEILMENHKQILPKERLIEKVWGYESEAEYNVIEVYMSFLRRKLAAIGAEVSIKAIRGVGYILEEKDD
ncbi:MAG TPA: response regulator transcription factor [Candidatus Dorea intestinavium]|nr:response regulator transcription factor [Candidatus Dorea intestinavium]